MTYDEIVGLSSYFGYEEKTVKEYIDGFKSADELSFLDKEKENRLVQKLSDEDREKMDKGYAILKEKRPDMKVSYAEFRANKITVDGQQKKLFKLIGDQKLSEEIGKYKLPDKDLYIIISNNFNDMVLASTGNSSWTSCIDLGNDGDFRFTALSNIFTKGRFIVYITDMTEKEYDGIKSYNTFFRTFGFVASDGRLVCSLCYPDRVQFEYEEGAVPLHAIKGFSRSKYPIEPVFNKYGFYIPPYFDNGVVVKEKGKFNFICNERMMSYKPVVISGDELVLYEDVFSHDGGEMDGCFKRYCDICGAKGAMITTFNKKNYCPKCAMERIDDCQFCGKKAKCHLTTEGLLICDECIERKAMKVCVTCGSAFRSKRLKNCEYCRSKSADAYRKFEYYDKTRSNTYTYEKHFILDKVPEPEELIWNEETGEYEEKAAV